jgi:predicted acetyltransferase
MSVEIRPATPDDFDRIHAVVAYSFTADRSNEGRTAMRHLEELTQAYVLQDGGETVACLRIYDFQVLINGAPVPMGGVSAVACLPEARRKGHVGRLLRYALERMRENGQPLSGLYTPHPSLYRRYGWAYASAAVKTTFNPKDLALHIKAPPAGRAVRVTDEDWPALESIYARHTARRTGWHMRSERWWKEAVFRRLYEDKRPLCDVAVWESAAGEQSGYVSYLPSRQGEFGKSSLWIQELIALDRDAYLGLLRYILSHDLIDEVVWFAPVDEPFSTVLEDSDHRILKREYGDMVMLRVVDIEKAVPARPAGTGAPDGAFTLAITDASAPWNQGTWLIESSGGSLSAVRKDGPADITTDAATFAAIYNGYLRTNDAVRSGLTEISAPEAAALADRLFASDYPPYGSDFF